MTLVAGLFSPALAKTYDVVVYGGTSAGVIAAVQVARMGKTVTIVCPETHLGGLTSSGLGFTDAGNTAAIGGLARDFYHRIWRHYQDDAAWNWQPRHEFGNRGQGSAAIDGENRTMWVFEPHVAEAVFEGLIAEHNIPVHRDEWLDRRPGRGVIAVDRAIDKILTLSGAEYAAQAFIDATYEGDLLAAAGVKYHVGREANSVYGETHNGVQAALAHHRHNFRVLPRPIDPYVVLGDPASGLLPRISAERPGPDGSGDHRIQAYCYRMCLTDLAANRLPFPKPARYDASQYALLLRVFETGWRETFDKFDAIPNRKTDVNNHGPFSTDNIGFNFAYPEASYERRAEILAEHRDYQQGLMYFLANDPRVPAGVRTEAARWGLAKDEFTDNGGWPRQIYVREARRMIGAYVMTENDVRGTRETPDSVGMGSYTLDSHNVQRYVDADGFVQNEGDVGVAVPPYKIAYGSLTPNKTECTNLLVPVCVSSSHIAFGSIRMEPVFMVLGQSAGAAAVLSIELATPVQDIPYETLRKRLLAGGQILETPAKMTDRGQSSLNRARD
jgi:hypothetical protein